MEYITEKDQKTHKLSDGEKSEIAKRIVDNFDTYDRARVEQADKAHRLIDEIYFKKQVPKSKSEDKQWKSTVKMCKIFMYSQILKAFIWKNTYANTNSMFDVSGENLEADNNSNKEKTMLVDCMEKMDYSRSLDKIIDKSLYWGELISFTTWKKRTEEYRRPISFFDGINKPANLPKMLAAKLKGEEFYVDEREIYNNPYTYEVDPENFVFDSSQFDNFDSCPKIYKTWKTPDYIISNKYFKVSKEVADDLKSMVDNIGDEGELGNQEQSKFKDERINGTTVEMLEHWGDLTLPNGTVLKNWYAVVVAGKYLVRFEKNPLVINPFTFGAYCIDPDTKRGISPLYGIYELALTQEDMLRRTMDLQALTENPPVYAASGFFKNTQDIDLNPGKIIEYDPQMYANIPVKPMDFNTTIFQNDLSYLDDLMSEISGIFPNMAGASESDRTTATEISTKVEGQLTRLKMLLDIINQNLILPSVEKIAQLKANFTFGDEEVFVNNDNKQQSVVINDEIRQAQYRFTYADRSATSERFNFADMVAQSAQMFAKNGLRINLQEFFTWYMGQKGVENPERFLDESLIPTDVQEILMQNPMVAQIVERIKANLQSMGGENKNASEGTEPPQIEQPAQPSENDFLDTLNHLKGRNLLSNG